MLTAQTAYQVQFSDSAAGGLQLALSGEWRSANTLPNAQALLEGRESANQIRRVEVDARDLSEWDSGLLVFLSQLRDYCVERQIEFRQESLPRELQSLLELAFAADGREPSSQCPNRESFIEELGIKGVKLAKETREIVQFVGSACAAFGDLLIGRSRMRWNDLFVTIQQAGPEAFPIVALISFLVGLILAFIGTVQLEKFGAQIYVANLVGIGMLREMGAVMAGVIIAGRTGAAFAAEIGAMQSNEEIDALKTLGISPMEFLVLPRMLALMLMLPLLCVFADLVGILGGALVSFSVFHLSPLLYWEQTIGAVSTSDFMLGLIKSVVFGSLVAVSGCLRGMQSGRSSAEVGNATTSAVVTGIVLIVLTDAVFAVVCSILGV
ncbi:MAG: ABC transporter permease [Bdellovibrionales bacterium]|nr:ABC transporter permease [Bdellovibrionales bacterium]